MKIYKTAALVYGAGEPAYVFIDTIEYEGGLWLVPSWIEKPHEGYKTPERIVLMEKYLQAPPGIPADFVLGYPLSIEEGADQVPPEAITGPVVKNLPDTRVTIPKGIH